MWIRIKIHKGPNYTRELTKSSNYSYLGIAIYELRNIKYKDLKTHIRNNYVRWKTHLYSKEMSFQS